MQIPKCCLNMLCVMNRFSIDKLCVITFISTPIIITHAGLNVSNIFLLKMFRLLSNGIEMWFGNSNSFTQNPTVINTTACKRT